MRKGHVLAVALSVFLVATVILVYFSRTGADTAAGSTSDTGETSTPPADTADDSETTAAQPKTPARDDRAASNVDLTALGPDDTPPQFVLFSLDGAGSPSIWEQFLAGADESDARFTAFLTGAYLLDNDHAAQYTGPGRDAGVSAVGFGGSPDDIAHEIADLNAAYVAGHEIATHYVGHFCTEDDAGETTWTTEDWASELGQFMRLVDEWSTINEYSDVDQLLFTSDDVVGSRTPCLERDLTAAAPVWRDRGIIYDSSQNLYTGLGWPALQDGVWEFQIPYVAAPEFGRKVIALNYNMEAAYQANDGAASGLPAAISQTYRSWFDAVYDGNRAPLVIETHANHIADDAFIEAALGLMAEVCGLDDVVCATHQDVVAWLEVQDPDVLAAWQARPVVGAE